MTTRETPVGVGRAFFGPPRTRAEAVLGVGGGALAMALLAAYIQHAGGWQDWSAVQIAVAAVFGADLIGGIVTTSAPTSNRWYHRPGPAAKRFRVGFVLAHTVLYLAPAAAAATLAGLIWLPIPAAVAWLPVLLFVKVLVCFSVPGVAAPSADMHALRCMHYLGSLAGMNATGHQTHVHPEHTHGPDCGHEAIPHDDHVDYLHDGHRHAPHGDHYDEH